MIRTGRKAKRGLDDAPSEAKDVEHGLVIPHKHTRSHLEMFLALHYDLHTGQSAENGVEGAGDDIVDVVTPSHEGKGKRRAKSQRRAKAEAAKVQDVADVVSGEWRRLQEAMEEVCREADIGNGLQDERDEGHVVGPGRYAEQSRFGDRVEHVIPCLSRM